MNAILKVVLSLSLSGTLLLLIVLLCKPFLKNRISRRFQYLVWLVVIARLLLPFSPEKSLMGMLFQESRPTVIHTDLNPDPVTVPTPLPGISGFPDETNPPEDAQKTTYNSIPLADVLWLLWPAAALLLFMRKVTIYKSFTRYVRTGSEPVSDPSVLDRLALIGERAGVKKPMELLVNTQVSSPLLIGFLKPCIVLPRVSLPEADFTYTILHELTHYKRRDMFYKWLVQLTVSLHWFNPFVYVLSREISKDCELSCDEAVLKGLGEVERRAYGDTLLNAAAAGGQNYNPLCSVTLFDSKALLKERLYAIMKFEKKKLSAAVSLTLAFALCLGATAAGAYREPTPKPIPYAAKKSSGQTDALTAKKEPAADELETLASRYYADGENGKLAAIFSMLNKDVQKEYCAKMVEKGEVAMLASVTERSANTELILFSAEKAYEQEALACFASIAPYLTEEQKKSFAVRASREERNSYLAVISRTYTDATEKPEQKLTYSYIQRCYYQDGFLIYFGWNIGETYAGSYPEKAQLTLADKTTLAVSFADTCAGQSENQALLSALKALVERLKAEGADQDLPLKTPLVVSVDTMNDDLLKK